MTTNVLNTKISEVENKLPNISSLLTAIVLNTKISEVENKTSDNSTYITTHKFNKLTSFNKRITSNKTKYLKVQKKLNSLIQKIIVFSLVEVMMDLKTHFFINQHFIQLK